MSEFPAPPPPCLPGRKSHAVGRGRENGRLFCLLCGYLYPSADESGVPKGPAKQRKAPGSKTMRFLVERDGPECHWCGVVTVTFDPGAGRQPNARTVEHLLPRVQGGGHERENLVLACSRCNNSRGGSITDIARWNVRMTEEGHRCDNPVCKTIT